MTVKTKPQRRPAHSRPGTRTRQRVSSDRLGLRPGAAAEPAPVTPRSERERRLEEVVLTTWAALNAGHPIECPVCGGALTAASGCAGCGSRLT